MPWPEYNEILQEFFRIAVSEWWYDRNCDPGEASRIIRNPDIIKNATLSQIKTMFSYFPRGERLCDGHWATMIQEGYIRSILECLAINRWSQGKTRKTIHAVSNEQIARGGSNGST